MVYNKAREERKWKKWKEKEERVLRQEGMSESKIMELRQYDWKLFNADRRFKEKQFTNNQLMDYVGTVYIQLPIRNFFHFSSPKTIVNNRCIQLVKKE